MKKYHAALCLSFFLTIFTSAIFASPGKDKPIFCGHEDATQQAQTYGKLNYGLAWFEGTDAKQRASCIMTKPDKSNPNFTRRKKHALIFIHGWSPNTVQAHWRFNFDVSDPRFKGPNIQNTAALWMKGDGNTRQPWNVGIFYWNQFADETPKKKSIKSMINAVAKAEQKIWRNYSGEKKHLTWKDDKGVMHNDGPKKNIAELFYQQYVKQFKGYRGEVRIVGESLGTQVTIAGAMLIDQHHKKDHVPLPQQIVILDPVFTKRNPYLGNKSMIQQSMKDIAQLEKDGVVVVGYRTSILGHNPFMADNTQLLNMTVFSDLSPCVYKDSDLGHRHLAGTWWYMLSYGLDGVPLKYKKNSDVIVSSAPYANMPISQLKKILDDNKVSFASEMFFDRNNYCQNIDSDFSRDIKEWSDWRVREKLKNTNLLEIFGL